MPKFSDLSARRLSECDPRLQIVFNEVIKIFDCAITEGHRPKETQDSYYKQGKSDVQWPNSKHNSAPSKAVDCVPCIGGKVDYGDKINRYFAGIVYAVAAMKGVPIKIRWGGDWDSDYDFTDQKFNDLVHYEIKD